MAFHRKRGNRRSTVGKSKKAKDGNKLVNKRQLKRAINYARELKFMQNTSTAADYVTMDNIGNNMYGLTNIVQSTTASSDTTRVGDEVEIKHLEFRCTLACTAGSGSARVIVFQWMGPAVPLAGNVLYGNFSTEVTNMAFPHPDYNPIIHVLYDTLVPLDINGIGAQTIAKRIRPKAKKVRYQVGSTAGIGEIYVLFLASQATILFAYNCKTAFYDA